jgi:hypothetical protein
MIFIEDKRNVASVVEIEPDEKGYDEQYREKGNQFPGHLRAPPNG